MHSFSGWRSAERDETRNAQPGRMRGMGETRLKDVRTKEAGEGRGAGGGKPNTGGAGGARITGQLSSGGRREEVWTTDGHETRVDANLMSKKPQVVTGTCVISKSIPVLTGILSARYLRTGDSYVQVFPMDKPTGNLCKYFVLVG